MNKAIGKKHRVMQLSLASLLAAAAGAQANSFTMDSTHLRAGDVAPGKQCVTAAIGFRVTARTRDGRVTVYKTNNPNDGHGFYIGAPKQPPYTIGNKTAPDNGTYQLMFDPPVTGISLKIDWISNQFQPAETLSEFKVEGSPVQVQFQPAGNSANFDGSTILAQHDRGKGTLSYSGKPFKSFSFRHQQHPRNIGFSITEIQAAPLSPKCK